METTAQSQTTNTTGTLNQDVASLGRVRNRLAVASDTQLPKILAALLPKLMVRLEGYDEISANENVECQKLRLDAKVMTWGILSHALERLKGNPKITVIDIMHALLPFIASKNLVVGTWALAFQQLFIQRISSECLPSAMVAGLIECIDLVRREQIQEPCEKKKKRLTNASWLLFDCIMLLSGLTPMVDWERDTFDAKDMRWKTQKSDSWVPLVSEEVVEAAGVDGSGVFHLFLDLLLFWPTESPVSSGISTDGDDRMRDRSVIPPEEHSVVGRGFARTVVRHKWTDMTQLYLRHLKLCALRFTSWPSDKALFCGKNSDRALVLNALLISHNSMHGRLAADYLNEYDAKKKLFKNDNQFQTTSSSCSIYVASVLLIIIVGERRAQPVLRAYEENNNSNFWEDILGPAASSESMQRPPLPLAVAARAVNFLFHHNLELSVQNNLSREISKLLIDLTLLMSHPEENDAREEIEIKQRKYWALLLVKHFYGQLMESPLVKNDDEWSTQLFGKCLDASHEVLSVVVEVGESRRAPKVDRNGQLPLGVPVPFNNRNDLNILLHTHRETKKRNNLQMDESLQARKIAYNMIARFAKNALDTETKSFEWGIFLLKCAVHENTFLQPAATNVLEVLLKEYTAKLSTSSMGMNVDGSEPNDSSSLREQAVPLLGCLLDAVLSESDIIRSAAAEWISKLLRYLDSEAAYHLASYLTNDSDAKVAAIAKSVLGGKINLDEDVAMNMPFFNFIDTEIASEKELLERELRSRIETVSRELEISAESAAIVCYDCKFSIDEVRTTSSINPQEIILSSGVGRLDDMACENSVLERQEEFCSICYDELGVDSWFALHCGHKFCKVCWVAFLETASMEGGTKLLNTRCPEHKCSARVQSNHIQAIAPSLYPRWNLAYMNAFIEFDPSYKFCPGPDCSAVAMVPLPDHRDQSLVCEKCKWPFCFSCGEKPHQPATCKDFAELNKIMGSSSFWIIKNSKPCPGCNVPIEKSTGCNHMSCNQCQQQFCWLCLTKLSRHSEDHTCNRYDPGTSGGDDYERHAVFVSDRYKAHEEAEEFACDHLKRFHENPDKLVVMFWFLTAEDEIILRDALETVVSARRVLKNSYIASFGLREHPQKMKTLERHQGALEMFTERLSQLTEQNLHTMLVEKGQSNMIRHFQGLGFYGISVSRYMQRFLDVCKRLRKDCST